MISGDQLNSFLQDQSVFAFEADKDYSLPSRAWVFGEFAEGLASLLQPVGLRLDAGERRL